jgi:hypothetical protein
MVRDDSESTASSSRLAPVAWTRSANASRRSTTPTLGLGQPYAQEFIERRKPAEGQIHVARRCASGSKSNALSPGTRTRTDGTSACTSR